MSQFMKTVALDQMSGTGLIVLAFAVMLFCLSLAWFIDMLVPDLSFGFFGNTVLIFILLWSGLYGYGRYIGPLKYNTAIMNVGIGVGTAIVGMMLLCLIKSRPFSR